MFEKVLIYLFICSKKREEEVNKYEYNAFSSSSSTTPHKNIETNSGFTRKIDISSHMESLKFQSGNDETA